MQDEDAVEKLRFSHKSSETRNLGNYYLRYWGVGEMG